MPKQEQINENNNEKSENNIENADDAKVSAIANAMAGMKVSVESKENSIITAAGTATQVEETVPKQNDVENVTAAALSENDDSPSDNLNIPAEFNVLTKQALLQAVTDVVTNSNLENKHFAFWSTQPVPKLSEVITTNEAIEPDKDIKDIRPEPYTLPAGFKWVTLDLNDRRDLMELYTLLSENYVEDDDAMFRFDYQPEFLKWSLQPPGWKRDWHVGVRVEKSGRLVAFISAIPSKLRTYGKTLKVVDINFLCVHKRLRSKRVAPVLIREITRRVNLTGIFQAAYTAGVVLPKPVSTCRYWHRSLNPKKLIEVKFSHLARNMTMQRTIKLFRLADKPKIKGYRRILPKDMDKAHKLLEEYFKKFLLSPVFSKEEFRHWFTPKAGIIDCFVVEDEQGNITDLTSYYCLPSSVMHHPVHKTVYSAYSFYNVSTKTPWYDLMNDALISARDAQMDVYNALDLMENKKFLVSLKFGAGDGNLQYYLYNWRCPSMKPENIALILM